MSQQLLSPDSAKACVVCLLSPEQQADYRADFEPAMGERVEWIFESSPDAAFELIAARSPELVLVGMAVEAMDGLEFLALLMQRVKSFQGTVVVLPDKQDPFPPMIQRKDPVTLRSVTEETTLSGILGLVSALTVPKAGTASGKAVPATPAVAKPAVIPKGRAPTQLGLGPPDLAAPRARPAEPLRAALSSASARQPSPPRVTAQPIRSVGTPQAEPAQGAAEDDWEPTAPAQGLPRPAPPAPLPQSPAPLPQSPAPLPEPPAPLPQSPASVVAPPVMAPPIDRASPSTALVEARTVEPAGVAAPTPGAPAARRRSLGLVAALGVLVVIGSAGAWWLVGGSRSSPALQSSASVPVPPPSMLASVRSMPPAPPAMEQPPATKASASSPSANSPSAPELVALPIRFDKGMSEGTVADVAELSTVFAGYVRELEAQPAKRIEVGGHTSGEGSPEVNQRVGQARAESVVPMLVQRGVPANRILVRNYTSSLPVTREVSSTGWDPNRRVTVRLVD